MSFGKGHLCFYKNKNLNIPFLSRKTELALDSDQVTEFDTIGAQTSTLKYIQGRFCKKFPALFLF